MASANQDVEWRGDDRIVLQTVAHITATMSLVASLMIIFLYIFWKRFHSQAAKMSCYMAVADAVSMTCKGVGMMGLTSGNNSLHRHFLCQGQAALQTWGDLSSLLWLSIMGVNILLVLCFRKGLADLRRYEKWYLLLGYVVPIFVAVPPLFVRNPHMYGEAGLWCWIEYEHYNIYRLILFYIPLWIIFAFNVCVYCISGYYIWKRSKVTEKLTSGNSTGLSTYRRIYVRNVSIYILAFLIIWTPATINRVYQTIVRDKLFILSFLQCFFSPLRGCVHLCTFFYITYSRGSRSKESNAAITTTNRNDDDDASFRSEMKLEHRKETNPRIRDF